MKKLLALLLVFLMVLSMLAGCAPADDKQPSGDDAPDAGDDAPSGDDAQDTADGEKDYVVFPANFLFNSTQSGVTDTTYNGGQNGQNMVLETLCAYDVEKGEYVPQLAEKVEASADGLTYTVTLHDATFHDGSPVTADDVLFSYNYAAQ